MPSTRRLDLDAQVKELQRQANEAKSMKAAAAKEKKRAAAEKACEMEDEEIDGAAPKPAHVRPKPPAAHKPSAARKGKAAAVPKSKAAPEPPTKPQPRAANQAASQAVGALVGNGDLRRLFHVHQRKGSGGHRP